MQFLNYKKVVPLYKNQFVLEVEYMFGDADAYNSEEFSFDDEETELLSKYIMLLKKMKVYWPYGFHGDDSYTKKYLPELDDEDIDESIVQYMEMFGPGNVEDFKLFYYDGQSEKYEIDYILTDSETKEIKDFDNLRRNSPVSQDEIDKDD